MSILEVPGARLHYQTHGGGPLMLLVHGGPADADSFQMVTRHLAARYTVITYDRRGFPRSRLDGPQDYEHRLETDADDLRRLIEHAGEGAATIVGCSSGALVGLELLSRHPAAVDTLVPFEPPAVRQLPDGQTWVNFFFEIYDLYHRSGMDTAAETFHTRAFVESDRAAMARARESNAPGEYSLSNAVYWFEHELRQYPALDLDLDALTAHADQLVLAVGRDSSGYPCYEVNMELGNKLRQDVIELPGGHVGCTAQPAEFAHELMEALERRHGPRAPADVVNTGD